MKIARLITTMACNRSCDYCCNKYNSLVDKAIDIPTLDSILDSDVVCLTGGEPMLYPSKLIEIIKTLRAGSLLMGKPDQKIYLYSASFYSPDFMYSLRDLIPLVDGIHFTLHAKTNINDIRGFEALQAAIKEYKKFSELGTKSFRAYIAPDIIYDIPVFPNLWSRLEIKPWIPEGKCPLPPNETLYRLVTP
jgi:pyruvate formate-lyase activating enzyme-like uncharacterized protein